VRVSGDLEIGEEAGRFLGAYFQDSSSHGWRYVGKAFEADPSRRFGMTNSFIFCEVKTFGRIFYQSLGADLPGIQIHKTI
jgi:hypothetical protein